MSILKGILHHWNKTNSAYDTIHPETESAQITDWHSGIMSSLASKTLGTVVDAITTDSVLGKLIKMLLNASGVKYLIDTNGYICFGEFFGGLMIQWGTFSSSSDGNSTITFPTNFSSEAFAFVIQPEDTADENEHVSYWSLNNSGVSIYCTEQINGSSGVKATALTGTYFVVGA